MTSVAGNPLPNIAVIFSTTLGRFSTANVTTNDNGQASVTLFHAGIPGAATVNATALGAGNAVSASTTITLLGQPAFVSILADPDFIALGESLTIAAIVRDPAGNPLPGTTVFFSTTLGLLSSAAATTDNAGQAIVTLTATGSSGAAIITATVDNVSAQTTVTFFAVPATLTTRAVPTGAGVPAGSSVADTATVMGTRGPAIDGTVSFFLCQPGEITPGVGCVSPNGAPIGGPVAVDQNGQADSVTTSDTTASGTYCWRAEYSGGSVYQAVSHTDFGAECFATVAPSAIDELLDTTADVQFDEGGNSFFEVSSPDGSTTVRVTDVPPEVETFRLQADQLTGSALTVIIEGLDAEDQGLLEQSVGTVEAIEVLVTDDANGAKIPSRINLALTPQPGSQPNYLLALILDPDGVLAPVPHTIAPDGRIAIEVALDAVFLLIEMPEAGQFLARGLNAIVYTGPEIPANVAFPGGIGRGSGIIAIWRFNTPSGTFLPFFPDLPQANVPTLRQFDPMFVNAGTDTAAMRQGRLAPVRRSLLLVPGPNIVSYTGSGGAIENVVGARVLAVTETVWVWSRERKRWSGYFVGQPSVIQGVARLSLGDFVFVAPIDTVIWAMR